MINMAQVLGRVGKIETKTLNSGNKITNISMVTSKKYLKDGVKQEKTTWHNVTCYNKLAEIAEKYVNKGDLLYIKGEMDVQKWTDQAGLERTKFYIIGNELQLMPKAKEFKPEPTQEAKAAATDFEFNDDVPW